VLGYLYRDATAAVAARHFDRALVQAQRLNLRPCVARVLVENAHLSRKAGRQGEAQNLSRQATRLAQDMGLASAAGFAWGRVGITGVLA
jgi:hypothetical protein